MRPRRDLADPPRPGSTVRGWFSSRSTTGRIAATLVTIVVVLGAAAFAERLWLGTWPFADKPDRLSYCGATYGHREDGVRVEGRLYPAFTYSAPLVETREVFSPNAPDARWGDTPMCTGVLYLSIGDGRYASYRIEQPR